MPLPLIAAAAIASAGIGAIGAVLSGVGRKKSAYAEAAALEQRAAQDRQEAGVEASLALAEGERAAGRAATLAAASGGGLTGSALSVIDDLGMQSIFNARKAAYEGETSARANVASAGAARQGGKAALTSSIFSAGSTLLGGFASASMAKASAGAGARASQLKGLKGLY